MLKRILTICLILTLSFTTIGCGSSTSVNTTAKPTTTFTNNTSIPNNNIPVGKYPVQQATFNDVDGEYTLMLLNTPAGSNNIFKSTNMQMARLTEEEIKAGEKTYAEINGNEGVMHLTEDFRIEYVHNETQTVTNPDTGRQETVVIRRESSFWSPFAGALAGQALGSLLFTPRYYVPPVYQPGGLTGFGGYGTTYGDAVQSYRKTYNEPPNVEKNRTSFRTTGTIKNSANTSTTKINSKGTKATGSGFGSSDLKTNSNSSKKVTKPSSNSFGTSRPSTKSNRSTPTRRSSGFGSRGRRR